MEIPTISDPTCLIVVDNWRARTSCACAAEAVPVIDAYTLALATTVLSFRSLADRIGRRRLFAGGMALFTAASAACGLARTISAPDIARAVQGVGAAAMFATSLAILSVIYREPKERWSPSWSFSTAPARRCCRWDCSRPGRSAALR